MLAAYLAHSQSLSAADAIIKIRQLRPGSIDTEQQAQQVHAFVDSIQQK